MVGGVRKGTWTEEEDSLMTKCIEKYGEGKWHQIPLRAGLNRCRKSCRLRWLNYLRPNIKRGNFSNDEVDLMIRLHNLLGNRWSLIAGRLPGRTANDVKNYWNTHQIKKSNKPKHDNSPGFTIINPAEATTTESNVFKPRPRIFTRHNSIVSFFSSSSRDVEKSTPAIISSINNPSVELFEGLFQNDCNEVGPSWASQFSGEEEMERFFSEELLTFMTGNNEGDGDSGSKDKKNTSFWDNDVDESTINMDSIWDILEW